ncbi:MAG: hypothetical protein JWQ09_3137 [Segetibacter sp.]|nr:hypothetical protein [Segetibacter sp.]
MKELLSNIVLFCGGVNVKFLRDNCPNERHKFYPIGLGVIITASLGFISMMFASHAIFGANTFGQEFILFLFSLFWAFAIFTIDWGLIKTMRKSKDGEELSTWEKFKSVIPVFFRLGVAIILSFSISRPLEIKIYEKSLKAQIVRDKSAFIATEDSIKQAQNQATYESKISGFNSAIDSLNTAQRQGPQAESYKTNVEKSKSCPEELTALRSKNNSLIYGHSTALGNIKNRADSYRFGIVDSGYTKEARQSRAFHNSEIARLNNEIKNKADECSGYDSKVEKAETDDAVIYTQQRNNILSQQDVMKTSLAQKIKQDSIDRLATRKAADESFDSDHPGLPRSLASMSNFEKTSEGKAAGWVRFILLLVIICIDTAPIVIKLLTKRGVYEDIQEADENRMKFLTKQESYSNNHLITQLSLAQKEILTEAVKRWRNKEKNREGMENDYVNSNQQDNGNENN